MTTRQSLSGTGFTRCAVCKIDLKGRFVYLDEKIEALLGYTKEELFGKSFLEFLDEPSQVLINNLLAQRNHYETFFDTTCITAYDRGGTALCMRAVVSLNFIAGNPVNYQLIIDCDSDSAPQLAGAASPGVHKTLVEELAKLKSRVGWKDLLRLTCRLVGARQACVYLVGEDTLQPRSAVDQGGAVELESERIPQPADLHQHVARTGEEYSFVDGDAVRKVIEQGGVAPNEYVTCADFASGNRYLVRLLFAEDFDPKQAQSAIADTRIILRLAELVLDSERPDEGEMDASFDVRFTIGFLDSLGVAAFLTDCEGSVIGYNPSTLKIFKEEQLEGNYLDALNVLAGYNVTGFTRPVVDYITSAGEREQSPIELTVTVKTSASDEARLTVMKLGDEPGDLSGCFVLLPWHSAPMALASAGDSGEWLTALAGFARRLKSFEELAVKFNHEFYNQLGDVGNDRLANLSSAVRHLRSLVSELHRYTRMERSVESPKLTDLNLLVGEQLEKVKACYPEERISAEYGELPKIRTKPRLLGQALACVIDNCVSYTDKPVRSFSIEAVVENGNCRITISDNGFGISPRHLPSVFCLLYRAPDKKVLARPGNGLGLSMARRAVRLLGGEIDISSQVGDGTVVRITIPTE